MFQRNLFVTQNTLFVNQMTQNTLFYSIYHKIRTWRIWSWVNLRLENIKRNVSPEENKFGCFGFGNKNYIRFFWRLNFPARDFPPLIGDFWSLLQKIDVLPFWDCLTSILEVKKLNGWFWGNGMLPRMWFIAQTSAWGVWLAQTDISSRQLRI